MTEALYPFDPAEALDSAETIRFFLLEAFKIQDPAYIDAALTVVARASGLSELAIDLGYTREQISTAFTSSENFQSSTTIQVLHALGLTPPAFHKLRSGCA